MDKTGIITFKQKDKDSHFIYSFKISTIDAAKILEYIAKVEHEPAPLRDSKGRFKSLNDAGVKL